MFLETGTTPPTLQAPAATVTVHVKDAATAAKVKKAIDDAAGSSMTSGEKMALGGLALLAVLVFTGAIGGRRMARYG